MCDTFGMCFYSPKRANICPVKVASAFLSPREVNTMYAMSPFFLRRTEEQVLTRQSPSKGFTPSAVLPVAEAVTAGAAKRKQHITVV